MRALVRTARLIADLVRVVPVSVQYGHAGRVGVELTAQLDTYASDIQRTPTLPDFDQLVIERLAAESHLRRKTA